MLEYLASVLITLLYNANRDVKKIIDYYTKLLLPGNDSTERFVVLGLIIAIIYYFFSDKLRLTYTKEEIAMGEVKFDEEIDKIILDAKSHYHNYAVSHNIPWETVTHEYTKADQIVKKTKIEFHALREYYKIQYRWPLAEILIWWYATPSIFKTTIANSGNQGTSLLLIRSSKKDEL